MQPSARNLVLESARAAAAAAAAHSKSAKSAEEFAWSIAAARHAPMFQHAVNQAVGTTVVAANATRRKARVDAVSVAAAAAAKLAKKAAEECGPSSSVQQALALAGVPRSRRRGWAPRGRRA